MKNSSEGFDETWNAKWSYEATEKMPDFDAYGRPMKRGDYRIL